MFDQNGLSLDQAPPVQVVFGLFLMGSFFGIIAGLSLFYYRTDIYDFSSTAAIVMTHLLALGVMMSFMLGALFQMLPVIAGVVLESPLPKANMVSFLLFSGVTTLILGFVYHAPFLFLFASFFLGSALLYMGGIMLIQLRKLSHHSASSKGMLFALSSLCILVLLGLYLALTHAQLAGGDYFLQVRKLHYNFGLFGWMGLLIASISFQTVEMFYVTPAYPKIMSHYLPMGMFLVLLAMVLATVFSLAVIAFFQPLLYIGLALYGLITLLRLSQRKRPLADATIWFWRTGMGSLVLSMLLLLIAYFTGADTLLPSGAVLFLSFVLSVLFAMLYKIIPFLTWFHLNSQGYLTAPMMHEIIHPKTAKKHFFIHFTMIVSLLLSQTASWIIFAAATLMLLSFIWIGYQVWHAHKLYRHTRENSEKFDMGMMEGVS